MFLEDILLWGYIYSGVVAVLCNSSTVPLYDFVGHFFIVFNPSNSTELFGGSLILLALGCLLVYSFEFFFN